MRLAMKLLKLNFAVVMLLASGLKMAHAADNVQVDADSMEVIDSEHKTIFRGNVIATRPTDQIASATMIVTTDDVKQADGSTTSVTTFIDATGGVTITTKTQKITGDWAKFYVQENRLEVGGGVKVVQGKSVVKGTKLSINLKTNHMQVSGGRVHGSFVPN
jgi:lipopolysaccharide export system protein LptA